MDINQTLIFSTKPPKIKVPLMSPRGMYKPWILWYIKTIERARARLGMKGPNMNSKNQKVTFEMVAKAIGGSEAIDGFTFKGGVIVLKLSSPVEAGTEQTVLNIIQGLADKLNELDEVEHEYKVRSADFPSRTVTLRPWAYSKKEVYLIRLDSKLAVIKRFLRSAEDPAEVERLVEQQEALYKERARLTGHTS